MKCIDLKGTSWSRQYVRESVFQIREMFACGIRNPRLWNPDYCSRNSTNDWNPESRIQVPLKKTEIQYLQSGIHGVESRIQECLGSHGANGLKKETFSLIYMSVSVFFSAETFTCHIMIARLGKLWAMLFQSWVELRFGWITGIPNKSRGWLERPRNT